MTSESDRWAGVGFALFGLGILVLSYYCARYRLTTTRDAIIIQDPFRGEIRIDRSNSTWKYAGSRSGQEIIKFTLNDGRTIKIYSPIFDIRPYTRAG